ncbi:ATP synthase F1, delta subunit [Nitrosococcus halophilus Nc 4]|uniref:ATP synthase subunit delta n=1 Tax=Nitrosococcus halophilus (strain Nc4) TaxID=472759 RepID=D5C422_NITHN|nr:F0F1 ATP synthase subunit delta [Nitrosococcus halophilus]ADE16959.1 ATP synthase F1, delta subunit [Nitrosococcus halophilus Nc 4]
MAEKITIARPYANAVFELAQAQGNYDQWSGALNAFADLARDPEIQILIDDPRYTSDQLIELFVEIGGDTVTDAAKNFLKVLADNDRLSVLPEIATLFEQLRAETEETIEAEIISAKPLTEDQLNEIATALKRRLGREVTFSCKTDESLLGGVVIRAGDLVIDGSAIGKLNQLATSLLH